MEKDICIEWEVYKVNDDMDIIVSGRDCMDLYQELKEKGFNPIMSSQYEFKVRVDQETFKRLGNE